MYYIMTVYYFYRIYSLNNDYVYIGSTTDFKKRISTHKHYCNNEKSKKYNIKLYKTIRQNNGFENFIFEIIETIETDNKKIVLEKEQELMIKYNSNLNTNKAYTSEEYKKQQKYEKITCACNGRYTRAHKSEHLKSKKHKKFEEQQIINNTTNNITINFNITIQK